MALVSDGFSGDRFSNQIDKFRQNLGGLSQPLPKSGNSGIAQMLSQLTGMSAPSGGSGLSGILQQALAGGRERTSNPGEDIMADLARIGGALGQQETMSPEEQMLAQLSELLGGPPSMGNDQLMSMLQEATQGISSNYGAQINALRGQNQEARGDVREGSEAINSMYAQLAKEMQMGAGEEAEQGQQLAEQLQQLGQTQAQETQQDAGQLLEQNAAAAAGLGSPDIMRQLNAEINQETQRQTGAARSAATRNAAMETQISGAEQRHLRGRGHNSRLEGTNRAADLWADLQDFLQENQQKIAQIAGERDQAIAQAKAQISGDFSQNQGNAMQDYFDNQLSLANFALKLKDQEGGGEEDGMGDFLKMLPKQIGGPMALSAQMNNPQLDSIYEDISNNKSMQVGYVPGDLGGVRDAPLVNNATNMRAYVKRELGELGTDLPPQLEEVLVAMLLQQLQGSKEYR